MSSATANEGSSLGLAGYASTFFKLAARHPLLFVMMFFQYFIWGLWLPILGNKLQTLLATPELIGKLGEEEAIKSIAWPIAVISSTYGFGSILGPFLLGQLADRYFPAQRVLAVAHIIGGILLLLTATQTTFIPIFVLMFLYCSLYMPTMGLSNSVAFKALGESDSQYFAWIRNLGTIGWIAAGFFFTWYLNQYKPELALECLKIAGYLSIPFGFLCFFLPNTPPNVAKATDPIDKKSSIMESLGLLKNRSFAVLVFTAGLIGIMLAFYFQCEGRFLTSLGISENNIGSYMTIGQIVEMLVMLFVPVAVQKLGIKQTMIIGALFWAARFGLSILGQPVWLMIATIGFHGFCFGFFFVVAFMFVDKAASSDIKSTAQNLLIFIIYGLGTVVGNLIAGPLLAHFGSNWAGIWAGPFVLTLISIALFALLFNPKEIGDATDLSGVSHH